MKQTNATGEEEDRTEEIGLTIRYRDFCEAECVYILSVKAFLIPSAIPRIMTIGFSKTYSLMRNGRPRIAYVHIPPHRILDIQWEVDDTEGERV